LTKEIFVKKKFSQPAKIFANFLHNLQKYLSKNILHNIQKSLPKNILHNLPADAVDAEVGADGGDDVDDAEDNGGHVRLDRRPGRFEDGHLGSVL
jgi:hypothetical protein